MATDTRTEVDVLKLIKLSRQTNIEDWEEAHDNCIVLHFNTVGDPKLSLSIKFDAVIHGGELGDITVLEVIVSDDDGCVDFHSYRRNRYRADDIQLTAEALVEEALENDERITRFVVDAMSENWAPMTQNDYL